MKDLFPHSQVRPKQDDLKAAVEDALENGENVVAHAPTGLGKTAATLPPALAYGLEHDKTTFFVTPRHSQHEIAIEALKKVRERHNERFVAVDLIGKKWLCEAGAIANTYTEDDDDPACPRHDKTYENGHKLTDRARRKKNSLKGRIMRAEEVKEACDKVCPYEILMHLAAEADVIIGDYFHVFHPGVRDVIFSKSQMALSDCIVIVDEAHNLPDRTRHLASATITEQMLDDATREASNEGYYEEEEKLERLQRELQRIAKNELGMEDEVTVDEDTFKSRVENIADYDDLQDDLGSVANAVREDGGESVCGDIAEFMDKWTGQDKGFVRVLKRVRYGSSDPYLKLSYTCLNPQHATKAPLNQSHAAICMSGTLTPVDMYTDIFGLDRDETTLERYESPFPAENKMNLIVDTVTTRYKERDENQFQKIAWYLLKSIEHVPGNTGVFFPSYKLRDQVYEQLEERLERPVFKEDRTMDKEDKNTFLDAFHDKSDEGAVLLGVVGGSFGEGVDFPGDLMSAVFIVGLPLQRPDLETQALIDFYDDRFGRGWDYGYNYPAINRALQAAGRCIRSKNDRGVTVFLDERYTWDKYRSALPPEDFYTTQAPWQQIEHFFENGS